MGKLGDSPMDPMEPWSAKYNTTVAEESLNEASALLLQYIRSLGYNPERLSPAERSAYGRSNRFKNWASSHNQDVREETEALDEAGTGLLMSFIKAKGLSPLAMDGNQKAAYSRSSEFRIFKNKHMNEISASGEGGQDWADEITPAGKTAPLAKKKTVQEEADAKDTVTMDIPLLIRVLEFIREDVKTDMDLHRVVENLIDLRTEGVLTMEHYDRAVKIKAMKEEIEAIDELSKGTLTSYATKARSQAKSLSAHGDVAAKRTSVKSMTTALDKYRKATKRNIGAAGAESKARIMELKKMPDNMDGEDHITREDSDPCEKNYQMIGMKKKNGRPVPNCVPESVEEQVVAEGKDDKIAQLKKDHDTAVHWSKNETSPQKRAAARQKAEKIKAHLEKQYKQVVAEGLDKLTPQQKAHEYNLDVAQREMNRRHAEGEDMTGAKVDKKTYKIIKPKQKGVAEGIYGIEDSPMSATNSVKAMESKKTQSKAATLIKALHKKGVNESTYDWEKDDKNGETKEKEATAKFTLKGGKTMTGKPRDTVEIEPVLKARPNKPSGNMKTSV